MLNGWRRSPCFVKLLDPCLILQAKSMREKENSGNEGTYSPTKSDERRCSLSSLMICRNALLPFVAQDALWRSLLPFATQRPPTETLTSPLEPSLYGKATVSLGCRAPAPPDLHFPRPPVADELQPRSTRRRSPMSSSRGPCRRRASAPRPALRHTKLIRAAHRHGARVSAGRRRRARAGQTPALHAGMWAYTEGRRRRRGQSSVR